MGVSLVLISDFTLQGAIVEFVEQLTNNGEQWSMKVAVEDVLTRQRRAFWLSDQVWGCCDGPDSPTELVPIVFTSAFPFLLENPPPPSPRLSPGWQE